MQINPGLSFTRVSPTQIQIGSGFRALTITGVTGPVSKFIDLLREGIPDGQEQQKAQALKVDDFQTHTLLSKLRPVLVATPTKENFVKSVDPDHRASLARLRCVMPVFEHGKLVGFSPQDRQQFEKQRKSALLQIFGLGRTGTALTKIFQESGIGNIRVWDPVRVGATDLGTGLQKTYIGQIRSFAAAASLNPEFQRQNIHPTGWLKRPTLAGLATIHITLGGLDLEAIVEAELHRHPYLPVVIRDDEIDIGPWVVAEASACPLCLATWQDDSVEARTQRVRTLYEHAGGIETIAGAHLVAGLVATDVLAVVDSQQFRHQIPQTQHGTIPGLQTNTFTRVNLANGWVQTFEISPAPGCCAEIHEPKIASTSSP